MKEINQFVVSDSDTMAYQYLYNSCKAKLSKANEEINDLELKLANQHAGNAQLKEHLEREQSKHHDQSAGAEWLISLERIAKLENQLDTCKKALGKANSALNEQTSKSAAFDGAFQSRPAGECQKQAQHLQEEHEYITALRMQLDISKAIEAGMRKQKDKAEEKMRAAEKRTERMMETLDKKSSEVQKFKAQYQREKDGRYVKLRNCMVVDF